MCQSTKLIFCISLSLLSVPLLAQQDIITTLIGGGPNNLPAVDADLGGPVSGAVDAAGNFYISDFVNQRVFRVNTAGLLTVVAGNGIPGYTGDGVTGGAAEAQLNGPNAVAVDAAGNVYISDEHNSAIRKVDTTGTITTIAGGGFGSCLGGPGICQPSAVAVDSSGNLYTGDGVSCQIYKLVISTGTLSTYAGNGTCGSSGDGGLAINAEVGNPVSIAVDHAGNLYFGDSLTPRIRKITASSGIITTVAGTTFGFSGDGGPATKAQLTVGYVAVNSGGTVVTFADTFNNRVRQFTVGGKINTIAGSGNTGFCGDNGPALSACLYNPEGVAVSSSGSIYAADYSNYRVRQFTSGGTITTAAGNGGQTYTTPSSGTPPAGVVLYSPEGVISDLSNNIYVSDTGNYLVWQLPLALNEMNFFAGIPDVYGYTGDGGPATSAALNVPVGLARDGAGNVYIADSMNCVIRQVTPAGIISTFAGNHTCGFGGDGGPATSAELYYPRGLAVDSGDNLYIADTYNNAIRMVTSSSHTISTVAGNRMAGYFGDGGPATAAELYQPYGVALDGAGDLYIADTYNNRIRAVNATTRIISTVAGNGGMGYSGDGVATENSLYYPEDLKADANGNLFIADTVNNLLRWVDPTGIMTTFAGYQANFGFSGDGGAALAAELAYPTSISEDSFGNFLCADYYNYRVRAVTAFAGLAPSTRNLQFGLTQAGSLSTPQLVTLSGVGPLALDSISVSSGFMEFDDCGAYLANGQTCQVQVLFAPSASGIHTGTLTIVHNGYFSASTVINLTGEGTAISIKGNPVSFGSQLVRTTSAAKTVTVTNVGSGSITMGAITLSDTTDYNIVSNTCPAPGAALGGKASCAIQLTFSPASTGLKRAFLLINDSDPTSPQYVALSGTGTSKVVLNPSSVNFALTPVGVASAPTTITLTNNTGISLMLLTPALSFTGPFSQSGGTCKNGLVLATTKSCTIAVIFTPTAVGTETGTLTVFDTDTTSPQTASLTGTGTGVSFTPASLNVGSSSVGTQISGTVTITNVGPTPLLINNAVLTGNNAADFMAPANPSCGMNPLPPGWNCTITIYFTPSIVGKETASYLIYDNTLGSPQGLALSGTGQ